MTLENVQEILLKHHLFDIELTTRCNKSCWMCPRVFLTRKKEDMKEKVFEHLVEWLPFHANVFFAGFGEPTLHSKLSSYVKKLSQKNISTAVITNGKKLNENLIFELFESGLNKLEISFILPEEEEFMFDFLKNQLSKFQDKVVVVLILSEIDLQIERIIAFLKDMNYTVDYKKVHNRGGYLYHIEKSFLVSCGTFFKVTYINVRGEIQICSNDINNLNCIGNIFTMSFEDVLSYKRKFLGIRNISNLCSYCNDEYRQIHFENPYL
ncbi:MAG: radical SAM protein [Leptospiraceae bacterium]|nr:radical SAM protein [Leptospiraceae bacterium]